MAPGGGGEGGGGWGWPLGATGCGWLVEGCAQGGRSGFSCASATNAPAKRANGTTQQMENREDWGIIR